MAESSFTLLRAGLKERVLSEPQTPSAAAAPAAPAAPWSASQGYLFADPAGLDHGTNLWVVYMLQRLWKASKATQSSRWGQKVSKAKTWSSMDKIG